MAYLTLAQVGTFFLHAKIATVEEIDAYFFSGLVNEMHKDAYIYTPVRPQLTFSVVHRLKE